MYCCIVDMFRAGAGTGGLGLGVGVAVLLTLQWALHCTAQTYPYTTPSPAAITQPYVRTYLYSPEFTVFGNVKTIGGKQWGSGVLHSLTHLLTHSLTHSLIYSYDPNSLLNTTTLYLMYSLLHVLHFSLTHTHTHTHTSSSCFEYSNDHMSLPLFCCVF